MHIGGVEAFQQGFDGVRIQTSVIIKRCEQRGQEALKLVGHNLSNSIVAATEDFDSANTQRLVAAYFSQGGSVVPVRFCAPVYEATKRGFETPPPLAIRQ